MEARINNLDRLNKNQSLSLSLSFSLLTIQKHHPVFIFSAALLFTKHYTLVLLICISHFPTNKCRIQFIMTRGKHSIHIHICQLLNRVRLFSTPWTVVHQAPMSHRILQARILKWGVSCFSRGSSQPRDRTWVSCIASRFFTI